MSNHIGWHVVLTVQPDRWDEFVQLTDEMIDQTRRESGVLLYERYLDSENNLVHVLERYRDNNAAREHLAQFKQRFAARFESMTQRKSFWVFGEPDQDLAAIFDSMNASAASFLSGFRNA